MNGFSVDFFETNISQAKFISPLTPISGFILTNTGQFWKYVNLRKNKKLTIFLKSDSTQTNIVDLRSMMFIKELGYGWVVGQVTNKNIGVIFKFDTKSFKLYETNLMASLETTQGKYFK